MMISYLKFPLGDLTGHENTYSTVILYLLYFSTVSELNYMKVQNSTILEFITMNYDY